MSTRRRWWRRGAEDDFATEVASHLDLETDRLVSEGMAPEEARRAARRAFGNATRARERFRDSRPTAGIEHLARDLRYAARGLRYSPAFTMTTVLTLAAGIGLVTVVFAVFNAYFLRPFAVRTPDSLYLLRWQAQEAAGATFRWRDYQQLASRHDVFDGVVGEVIRPAVSDGRHVSIGYVSGNYFEALAPRLAFGRAIGSDDARTPGAQPVAVLSDQAWARLFGRDPSVLGRTIEANDVAMTVIGIMGPEFAGLDDVPRDLWAPITMYGALHETNLFGGNQPRLVRITTLLKPGVTAAQAAGSVSLEPFETTVAGRIDPVRAALVEQSTPVRLTAQGVAFLSPAFAAFGLVLVAACANASNVMLARANARHREIGIRLSIGASRGRIVRQLVTEGLLVAALAGGAGLAIAGALLRVGTYLFVALLPSTVAARARFVSFDFDARVFGFALAIAALATVLFALLPALQATRVSLTDALRGQPGGAIRSSTLRKLLITAQVTVSLLLLIVAATLVRNGTAIGATEVGFVTDRVISVRPGRNDPAVVARTYQALTADGRFGTPAVASRSPLFGETMRVPVVRGGHVVPASLTFVAPEYFSMLRIAVLHGRGFSLAETTGEALVAIVSASGAHALWPGEDPVGKTVRVHLPEPGARIQAGDTVVRSLRGVGQGPENATGTHAVTVIGVSADVVSGFVYQGKDAAHIYLPTSATGHRALALLVQLPTRVRLDTLKAALQTVQADPLAYDVLALDEIVALQRFPLRAASWLGTFLSGVALALSISGLYGVLTYTFGQRTREIGIRMALGATRASLTRLVVRESARLAAVGVAIGLALGFSIMKLLSTVVRLDNVSVIDPGAFAVSVLLIGLAVSVASLGPARRAVRVDPTAMLRDDG